MSNTSELRAYFFSQLLDSFNNKIITILYQMFYKQTTISLATFAINSLYKILSIPSASKTINKSAILLSLSSVVVASTLVNN